MTTESGSEQSGDAPARSFGRGVKKGLPTLGLVEAEDAASKIWGVARRGTAAPTALAKEFGLGKASGGTWRARLAHLRGFGVIREDDEEIGLSPVGLDLVQDFDEGRRLAARRKAFMTLKSYRELVDEYNETQLPATDKIASKLEHEYGKAADLLSKRLLPSSRRSNTPAC
jgi:hypothetical protein